MEDLFKIVKSRVKIDIKSPKKNKVNIPSDLLFKCQNWVKENGATLRIKIGDSYVHFTD